MELLTKEAVLQLNRNREGLKSGISTVEVWGRGKPGKIRRYLAMVHKLGTANYLTFADVSEGTGISCRDVELSAISAVEPKDSGKDVSHKIIANVQRLGLDIASKGTGDTREFGFLIKSLIQQDGGKGKK